MKSSFLFKSIFLAILLTSFLNGCSVNDSMNFDLWENGKSNSNSKIVFIKSSDNNWKNKKIEVSFEDTFQDFSPIDQKSLSENHKGFVLTTNNLKQGIAIRLKVIDFLKNSFKIKEIMIESYDLSKGLNQFTIGHKDNTPFIIY